jgi:hypothetical protein
VLTPETAHHAVCFDCEHVDETTKAVDAKGKPRGIAVMCRDARNRPAQ